MRAAALLVCLGLLAAGCSSTPGSAERPASETRVARPHAPLADGKHVTLEIVDTDNDPGSSRAADAVVEAFEARHRNVDVRRDAQNFDELMSRVGQLATSDRAPCIVHGSQGATDKALVKAGAIRSLEPYAKAYGWEKTFSPGQLATLRVADDGSTYGSGTLFGIAPKAEIVGVFYNKKLARALGLGGPPRTFAAFEETLQRAKRRGIPPIGLGLHDYNMLPGLLFDRFVEPRTVREWVFGKPGASVDSERGVKALDVIARWARRGYFYRDAIAVKDDDAVARFAKGRALYYLSGPWRNSSLTEALGDDVGFFPLPGSPARATGALSTPYHITSACPIPDVAGAYLGFATSREAAELLLANGDVPAIAVDAAGARGSQRDILDALERVARDDGLNPYKDWAAPGMSDVLIDVTQGLVSARIDPGEASALLQDARS
jgi:raffinose/stachyose/melibiose transport system substrate-binding protein